MSNISLNEMKKILFSLVAMLLLSVSGIAQSTTYTKVTSASGLEAGANYLIVAHNEELGVLAMGYQKPNNRNAVVVSEDGESITLVPGTDPDNEDDAFQITLGGSANAWTLFDEVKGGYLYAASSSSNNLKTQTTLDANGQWSITFNPDGTAEVVAQGENTRNNMRFNPNTSNNAPLFSCYAETSSIDTRVSFYKAGGGTIDPEPTNYPTAFFPLVDDFSVTLTWDDAVGGQLPSKYLVLASTGDITVPVDGVPVADGDMAKNVGYGIQTVTFSGLQGNTTYNFAIFPYTNGGSNIDYKTDGVYPETTATTENIQYLLFEDFNEDLGVFTAFNAYGEQEWHQSSNNQGVTYACINGYASGAPHQNEDWLISPAITIGENQWEAVTFEFRTAMKYEGPAIQVKLSTDYDGSSDPSDFTWMDFTDVFDYSSGNYEWVESGQLIIDQAMLIPGNYYFAFVYTSTDELAASWEIDYVKVMGLAYVSVDENTAQTVSIYPNPAREQVSVMLESEAQVSIFDMTGRMVSTMNMAAGQAQLNVSELENGMYFLNIRFADGTTAVSKFVKF